MYPFTYNTLGPFSARGAIPPAPPPPPPDSYPGAFWGFGHPSEFLGDTEPYGVMGFGDPSNLLAANQDTTPAIMGFGAPYDDYLSPSGVVGQGIQAGTPDGLPWFPDNGGEMLFLSGPWAGNPESFRVKVVNRDTGISYPNDPTKSLLGMRGIRPGSGVDLHVRGDGLIACSLCPLPPGVYDVRVLFGPGYAQAYVIEEAFRVVYRYYSREAWSIRSSVPAHWHGMGPRSIQAEPPVGANSAFPQRNYRSLSAAIAEEIQACGGKALTRLTSEVVWSLGESVLQVETTLGFPNAGTVFVGPWEYSYSGRTPVAFLNCLPKQVYPELALPSGTPVVSKPADWLPPD